MSLSTCLAASIPANNFVIFGTVDSLKEKATQIIADREKVFETVRSLPVSDLTFDNSVGLLERSAAEYGAIKSSITLKKQVSPEKEIRDVAVELAGKFSEYSVEWSMDASIYKQVKALCNSDGFKCLSPLEQRTTELTVRDFEDEGLNLPEEVQEELKAMKKDLSKMSIAFSQAINEDETTVKFTKEELSGLPDSFFEDKTLGDDSKYTLTIKYPDLLPVVRKCTVPSTRFTMLKAKEQSAPSNHDLLKKILVLRRQIAAKMGYKSHGYRNLHDKMSKNPENVDALYKRIIARLEPYLESELKTFSDLKEEFDGTRKVEAHDLAFLTDQYKMREHNINIDEIKQYFPTTHVINSTFEMLQETFGLKFSRVEDADVWHKDVEYYAAFDEKSDNFLFSFYLDLFPRDNKYSHACNSPGQMKADVAGYKQENCHTMICNFPKSTPQTPALMTFDDVVTFLHEFGHLIHLSMTENGFPRLSGICQVWDFIEVPSMTLENFAYETKFMKLLSSHYETGVSLPDDKIKSLQDARHIFPAVFHMRQLQYGMFDQIVHGVEEVEDIEALWISLKEKLTKIPNLPEGRAYQSFGHLCGYDALYYSYIWSDVKVAETFMEFKKNDFSREVADRYRNTILLKGYAEEPEELLKQFLGREPEEEAFYAHIGLVKE